MRNGTAPSLIPLPHPPRTHNEETHGYHHNERDEGILARGG